MLAAPRQFRPGMEALGIVLSFLSRRKPFEDFKAGPLIAAVEHQLASGCHACLIRDERLIAYAGWLPIRVEDGEKWLRSEIELRPVALAEADAAALTTVSVTSPAQIAPLIRACRKMTPRRVIYFARYYDGGRAKKARVWNVSSPEGQASVIPSAI